MNNWPKLFIGFLSIWEVAKIWKDIEHNTDKVSWEQRTERDSSLLEAIKYLKGPLSHGERRAMKGIEEDFPYYNFVY